MKPKIAAFPKCFMDELCVHHTMTLFEWIEMASTLGVEGLEFYTGFLNDDEGFLREVKDCLEKHELRMPMLCCSPDFTQPDPELLHAEIEREKRMIEAHCFLRRKVLSRAFRAATSGIISRSRRDPGCSSPEVSVTFRGEA